MSEDEGTAATSQGLIQCLRMLTEEAATLNLTQTFAALQDAMLTCHQEIAAGLHEAQTGPARARAAMH